MKTRVSTLFFVLFFVVCLNMNAQSGKQGQNEDEVIEFDSKMFDFGDVLVSDGHLNHVFTFKNISKSPIVVHNVVSTCGCAVPEWTKSPVLPSKTGTIKITFKNDIGAFPFEKSVTVYISGVNRPVIIKIRGVVHQNKKRPEELFTNKVGPLGFRKNVFSIGYIDQGDSKSDEIDLANLSDEKVTVDISRLSDPSVSIIVSPNPVPAGSTAKMTYTVNTSKGEKKWGKSSYSIGLSISGVGYDNILTFNGVVKYNFNNYTKEMVDKAPVPFIDKGYFEFGEVKKGKELEHTFILRNKGKSDLVIYKMESEREGVIFLSSLPVTIKPGKETGIKIKFVTKHFEGEVVNVITLITNSPSKPMMNFFITGNIVK